MTLFFFYKVCFLSAYCCYLFPMCILFKLKHDDVSVDRALFLKRKNEIEKLLILNRIFPIPDSIPVFSLKVLKQRYHFHYDLCRA